MAIYRTTIFGKKRDVYKTKAINSILSQTRDERVFCNEYKIISSIKTELVNEDQNEGREEESEVFEWLNILVS